MPLVNAKCTNCGANLEVDSAKDVANCPYCGAAYIVEKAIKNYSITNNTTNNINAEVVNVFGGNRDDFVIRGGVLEKYTGAATEVVIPDNVTIIGRDAFNGCVGVTSVKIPNSVTEIQDYAFCDCSHLSEMILPDGLQVIGGHAFAKCAELRQIIIPKTVSVIEEWAFYNSGIIHADIAANAIGSLAFSYCKNLQSIILREDVKKVGETAFQDCFNLKKVTIEGYPLMISSNPESRHFIHFGNYGMTIEEIHADRKWVSAYTSADLFLEKDVLDDALPQSVHKGRLKRQFKRQKRCLECGGKRIVVPKGIIGKKYVCEKCGKDLPEYLYVKEYYND